MAKHPHKLILLDKKTWRCTLEGCNFFVHLGLAHVLIGKQSICWNCNEQFTLDYSSLKREMPECNDCMDGGSGGISTNQRAMIIEAKLALGKAGVKFVKDLDPNKRRMIEVTMGVDFGPLEEWEKEWERQQQKKEQEKDEIEVIDE